MLETEQVLREALECAWLIAGPTASGKSQLAMAMAQRLDGEIISVDSMQVYRGMDIGTAKPTRADQQQVRHHLIDVAELQDSFDAAAFRRLAVAAILDIHKRSKTILLCGGTGFYFQALLQGVGKGPSGNQELRKQFQQWDLEALKDRLRQQDPLAYQRVDLNNRRKVIRALEVIELTGLPFSQSQSDWSMPLPLDPRKCWVFDMPASVLNRRIELRVERMLEEGWMEETRMLMKDGLEEAPTASQAIGYGQIMDHLRGKIDHKEMKEWIKIRTRQLAKRQRTWFRHQLEAKPLPAESSPDSMVETMVRQASSSG